MNPSHFLHATCISSHKTIHPCALDPAAVICLETNAAKNFVYPWTRCCMGLSKLWRTCWLLAFENSVLWKVILEYSFGVLHLRDLQFSEHVDTASQLIFSWRGTESKAAERRKKYKRRHRRNESASYPFRKSPSWFADRILQRTMRLQCAPLASVVLWMSSRTPSPIFLT